MAMMEIRLKNNPDAKEAISAFEREIGVTNVGADVRLAGDRAFLKFRVGRESPLYSHALLRTQKSLSPENQFQGLIGFNRSGGSSFKRGVSKFSRSECASYLINPLDR